MLRMLSGLCVVAAAGMLGLAAYSALHTEPVPEPPFAIAPAELDLGMVPLGDRDVSVAINNPAERPRRIIGVAEG